MATQPVKRIVRPQRVAVPAKPAPQPVVDLDEEEFEEDLDLDEEDAEFEEEEEEEAPVRKPARPAHQPAKAVAKPARPAPVTPTKPVVRKMEIPTVPPAELKEAVSDELLLQDNPFDELAQRLQDGETLLIQKKGKGWLVSKSDAAIQVAKGSGNGKFSGSDYSNEVVSDAYRNWQAEWSPLSMEEKRKKASAVGATWEPHEYMQTEAMRIAEAYREKMGIEKYNEGYRDTDPNGPANRREARRRFTS